MRPVAYWVSVCLLVVAILWLVEAQFHIIRGLLGPVSLGHREVATRVLGEYLATHFAGSKAVVLSNPFSTKPGQPREVYQYEKAGLQGLRKGLGVAVTLEAVAYPEIRPEFFQDRRAVPIDPATSTPLSFLVTKDSLDNISSQHPQALIIVSLIGLPVNVLQTQTWKRDTRFALLLPDLRMIGDQSSIRAAFRSGKVAAAVVNKPGAPSEDQPVAGDLKMEFDLRFLLVTPENIDQYLKAYPHLF
jgi:hypothetical protein